MKNKSKFVIFLVVLLTVFSFMLVKFLHSNSSKMQVSCIDLKKVDLTKTHSKFLYNRSEDSPKIATKFKKFDGIYVLDSSNFKKGDSINFKFNSNIREGKFNIIVIDNKCNPVKVIKPNLNGEETIRINEDGKYKIEMLGEKAKGEAFGYWNK